MRSLRSCLALALLAADRARRDRLLWFGLISAAVMAVGAAVWSGAVAVDVVGDDFAGPAMYVVAFQIGAPLFLTYLGVSAIHDEIADRSAVHLFVRPVSRLSILVARWLAVSLVGAVAVILVAVMIYWGAAARDLPWRLGLGPSPALVLTSVKAAFLAAPAYVAIGMLCGTLFRRPLIVAIAYAIGSELVLSNLPPRIGVRQLTVADSVRRFVALDFDPRADGEFARVLTLTLQRVDPNEFTPPVTNLAWITGVALVLGAWIYCHREYDSRPRD